jgi:hypothetical protein
MAANSGILIGWNRAFPGREANAIGKFSEFLGYLGKLQSEKRIESFEPVMLSPHGGDLNGFIILRGEKAKIDDLRGTDHFKDWLAWASFTLDGFGAQEIYLGDEIMSLMQRFMKHASAS